MRQETRDHIYQCGIIRENHFKQRFSMKEHMESGQELTTQDWRKWIWFKYATQGAARPNPEATIKYGLRS